MSSLNWKSRMFVAVTTASLLTGAGAVALANATTSTPDPTSAPRTDSSGTDATALQRSLDDLLSTVGGLEKAVADSATPAGTRSATRAGADDNGGTRPAGVSDDIASDDQGDDSYADDDSDDDSDSYGDDSDDDSTDNSSDDHGDDD